MKKLYWILAGIVVLSGCATAGTKVFVNPEKTAQEMALDETECRKVTGVTEEAASQTTYNQCMEERGYKLVPEKDAGRVKGFRQVWTDPNTDFEAYEVLVIDKVDVSEVKVKNMQVPGTKVTDEEIDSLGDQMQERFSNFLSAVIPVVSEKEAIGKRALRLRMKLTDIACTNVGVNAALQAVPVPYMPVSSKGLSSVEGDITDLSTGKKLVTMSDSTRAGKNSSLVGLEKFNKWKYTYETMDYWADCLAKFLAEKRGEPYKSQLNFKLF